MATRRGLGRGLSALIPGATQDSSEHGGREILVSQIAPNPKQPRTDIDESSLAELTESVKRVGVLQPILVRPVGEGYEIIAGERRWRAARAAGLERVPVLVSSRSDSDSLELALIENLQREDLNPIEEARGYRRLLNEHDMTQAELAGKVSKSRSAITNAMRLLDLPEEVQTYVFEGRLSAGHARAVLSVSEESARIRLAEKVIRERLSVREAENIARLYIGAQSGRGPRTPTPKAYKIVARSLRRALGATVRVKQTNKKGKIEIDFHGEEELERIFRLLVADRGHGSGGEVSP